MTDAVPPRLTRRDCLLLAGLVLLALALRLWLQHPYPVIASDGVSYARIARDFASGAGLGRAIHYPPFYPILMGMVSWLIPDIERAGMITAMVMGSLLAVPLYLLALEFFDRRTGIAAACLALAWPSLLRWSQEVMTQSTYITVSLMGVWCLWRSWHRGSWRAALAGGACMGMAHLTRSEGVVLYAALTIVLAGATFVLGLPRTRLWQLAAGWLVFWALCFPYVLFLHRVTGVWELTGKGKIAIADALSQYLGKPDLGRDPHYRELGLLDLVMDYPGYLRHTAARNFAAFREEFLPWYLWLLAAAGFLAGGWTRERAAERLYLLATFAPLALIIAVFLMGPEYDQPYLPVMFLWAGQGAVRLETGLYRLVRREAAQRWPGFAPVTLAAVVAFTGAQVYRQLPPDRGQPYDFLQDGGRYDQKRIGLMLAKELPPGARIMTRWGRIAFYADRDSVDFPQAELEEILATARRQGVRYLVVDGIVKDLRPQLGVLNEPVVMGGDPVFRRNTRYYPLPGIHLYLLCCDPSSIGVAVYELLP